MASIVNYVADGATNQFQIPFTYINQADVVVTVNGTTPTFTFVNTTTINIASTPVSGAKVIIKRVTPLNALVDFTDGSTLFEADLDLAHQQNRLIAEESRDRADSAIETLNANISDINSVASIEADVTTVAGNTTNVNSVATNMAEVLLADTNAATATTKAGEASTSAATATAQATIATTKAAEATTAKDAAVVAKNAAEAAAIVLSGSTMTGDLDFGDDIKAKFGDSDDLRVFHSAGNSFVQDAGAGDLFIAGSNAVRITNSDASEAYAAFNSNSGVDLYHDNTLRFQTSSTGISVAGDVFVTGTVDGRDILVDGNKLDTIESNADVTDTANVVASLTAGTNITIASDGTIASTASGGSSYTDSDAISAVTGSDLDMGGNKVLFSNVYSALGDLPSATDNHGMFAHVHATGKGYFAHGGNWVALANDADKLNLSGGTMTGDLTVPNLITSGNVDGRDIATNIPSSLGTAGQVLTVNAGATAGEWADAGGGGITTGKSIAMAMVFG